MQQQLDLFADTRDVGLRYDLAQALFAGKPDEAQCIVGVLRSEFGADPMLEPAIALIEYQRWRQSLATPGRLDAATVLDARQRLDGPVSTAAAVVLGAQQALPWLADQWCWLASRAADIGWDPFYADAHAAALYLRGQAWPRAAEEVARIDSWRRIPVPLLWMTQARWYGNGADAAWPLLAEALWLAPTLAAALLPTLAGARLDGLVTRFEECFDPDAASGVDWAWLPAFAVVDQPLLAGPLYSATPPAESATGEAFTVVMALLRLERQGRHREIVAHRARLQALSAPLFSAYMATR